MDVSTESPLAERVQRSLESKCCHLVSFRPGVIGYLLLMTFPGHVQSFHDKRAIVNSSYHLCIHLNFKLWKKMSSFMLACSCPMTMRSGTQRKENALFPVTILAVSWFNHLFFLRAPLYLEHLEFYALAEFPLTFSIARCFLFGFWKDSS